MKKIIGIMAVGLLLLGFAGQSMASNFAAGDLIRVTFVTNYDQYGNPLGPTTEYAADLGTLSSLEALTSTTVVGANFTQYTGTNFGTVTGGVLTSGIQVAYYVQGTGTASTSTAYIGSQSAPALGGGVSYSGLNSAFSSLKTLYSKTGNFISATQSAQVSEPTTGDYWEQFDGAGNNWGTFDNYLLGEGAAEYSLLPLETLGGYIDETLYGYNASGPTGSSVLDVRTIDVGGVGETEIVVASAVPVPPSLLLFVPGLLGLIGLRRKVN